MSTAPTGNISARLDDGFLITPTDACLGELEPEALVKVDAAGVPRRPARAAEQDARPAPAHLRRERRGAAASSTRTRAIWSRVEPARRRRRGARRPAAADHAVLRDEGRPRAADRLPRARARPGSATRSPRRSPTARARGAPIRAVMLARLGPNVWHETPAAAMARARGARGDRAPLARLRAASPAPLSRGADRRAAPPVRRALVTRRKEIAMPRFAANLSMMYREHAVPRSLRRGRGRRLRGGRVPVPVRMAGATTRAARCATTACSRCCSTRRPATSPPASAASPACPDARHEFRSGDRARPRLRRRASRCPRVHVMAGLAPAGASRARRCGRSTSTNLRWAAQKRGRRRRRRADRADQHARHSRATSSTARTRRTPIVAEVGSPQPQGADGPLPLPDRRRRRRDEAARATCRPAASATCRSPACPSATSPTSAR